MVNLFAFKDRYIAHDVESGAIHTLDKAAFDVLGVIQNKGDVYALPYSEEEIDEIIGELDELRALGYLDAAELLPHEEMGESVIKAMCLHLAHDCNLRCEYCFAGTGEFHGERMLMSENVAKKALDYLVEHSRDRHNLEVDLFGGEPLMNWGVLRETVAYGRELEKKHNKRINFTLTTNGVALDDEKLDYINKEMFNVVVSLDGRKEIHDALRKMVNGKGSFDLVARSAVKIAQSRADKECYVRGTFTNRNLDFTEDVKALLELGIDRISLEPVVLDEENVYAIREEHVEQILDEYERLADFIIEYRASGRKIIFFHFMVDFSGGPCLKKRVSGCGAGVEYVAVSPEGDVYPCHQFVGEKDCRMGSVIDGTFDDSIRERFKRCNILTKPECRACTAKYFCGGGCAANAHKYNGNINKPHTITCAFEKKRAECAMGIHVIESGI